MLARFSNGKYQDLVIQSFNKLLITNKNLRLSLVGEGENLSKCKEIVKNLNIQKKVSFENSIKLSDLTSWFKNIDVYIHLSKDEGLSTAILYAIQLNRPVIASLNNGNKFLLNKKGNYAIVVKNNILSVVSSFKLIGKNEKFIIKMIQRSKKHILKNFSSEKMFTQYNNILNEK